MNTSSQPDTIDRRVAPQAIALGIVISVIASLLMPGNAIAANDNQPTPATDAANDGRSTPGSVVPSTGTTGGSKALTTLPSSKGTSRCDALRKRYAESQACFEHFRLKNGGLRPGAAKQCKEIKNPSLQCGSEVVG